MKARLVVPPFPSFAWASAISSTGGGSSSRIVPEAVSSPSVALPLAWLSVMLNVSSASSSRSPFTGTDNVCVVTPAAKLSVPVVET